MADPQVRLDDRERALLDFEREWHRHQGRKASAISERFGISPARYYQLLTRALDRADAEGYDPLTVRRLRRQRAQRSRRVATRTGAGRHS